MVKFREIIPPSTGDEPPREPRTIELSNDQADKLESLEKRMSVRNWERVVETTTANAEPEQSTGKKGGSK